MAISRCVTVLESFDIFIWALAVLFFYELPQLTHTFSGTVGDIYVNGGSQENRVLYINQSILENHAFIRKLGFGPLL